MGQIYELARTFEDSYQYRTVQRLLTTKRSPQLQLNKYLADLLYEEDGENTLLIIYYAGNGIAGPDGGLQLAGK